MDNFILFLQGLAYFAFPVLCKERPLISGLTAASWIKNCFIKNDKPSLITLFCGFNNHGFHFLEISIMEIKGSCHGNAFKWDYGIFQLRLILYVLHLVRWYSRM